MDRIINIYDFLLNESELNIHHDFKSLLEQILKRVPFLKQFQNPETIELDRGKFNKFKSTLNKQFNDIKCFMGNELLIFKSVYVDIEFYFQQKYYNDDKEPVYFIQVQLKVYYTKPDNMDDLTYRVLSLANNQINEKLSYSHEIFPHNGGLNIDSEINNINKSFFEIEENLNKRYINILE